MKRIEDVYSKIKDLDKKDLPSSLNKEAAARLIKNSLSNDNIIDNRTEDSKSKRKLKGNVPVPELPHLNVNQFK